jgi:hypothetical protein
MDGDHNQPAIQPTMTLANIAGGAAMELFQRELDRVLENILDPNAPAESKRGIVLKVTFTPNPDRTQSGIAVECDARLAPAQGAGGVAFIGRRSGRAVAVPHNPQQYQMVFDKPAGVPTDGEDMDDAQRRAVMGG